MNKRFFGKMALSNIKNNKQTYIPFICTAVFTAAMFYIIVSLSKNSGLANSAGGITLKSMLQLGTWITGGFSFIFLFYTFSFLFKRRKKEIGVYNILGMEKKHISKVLCREIIIVFFISTILGLLLGMLLDKLMFLLVAKLLSTNVAMGFYISTNALIKTVVLMALIFVFIFLNSVRQIHFANPIELLKGGNTGEKEPKTKWLMALIGAGCLGVGYYLALTSDDIVGAMKNFAFAVALVIVGTYLVFIAGSIAFLKILKKNKNYYYKPAHFISVSGMIYRMKQNAVGLANICIMSTMVLVMLASTATLWAGINETVERQYPKDVKIESRLGDMDEAGSNKLFDVTEQAMRKEGVKFDNVVRYEHFWVTAEQKGDTFYTYGDSKVDDKQMTELYVINEDAYNKLLGKSEKLAENEVVVDTFERDYNEKTLKINEKSFNVKKTVNQGLPTVGENVNVYPTQFIVVKDKSVLADIKTAVNSHKGGTIGDIMYTYVCDSDMTKAQGEKVLENVSEQYQDGYDDRAYFQFKSVGEEMIRGLYAGLMFVGIFLSVLFIMAMILIMYYKQISEGHEDKERYRIMQNVGLDKKEIKSSIKSQIMTVFFLPLIMAGVHVAVAFPLVGRMMEAFGMNSFGLYLTVTVIAFFVFALFYSLVYTITSRIYYKIINK